MGKLEEVLELLKKGKTPTEISRELGITKEEVDGAINVLESLGYIERVELGSDACSACPLRKICGGSCLRLGGRILVGFTVSDKN